MGNDIANIPGYRAVSNQFLPQRCVKFANTRCQARLGERWNHRYGTSRDHRQTIDWLSLAQAREHTYLL